MSRPCGPSAGRCPEQYPAWISVPSRPNCSARAGPSHFLRPDRNASPATADGAGQLPSHVLSPQGTGEACSSACPRAGRLRAPLRFLSRLLQEPAEAEGLVLAQQSRDRRLFPLDQTSYFVPHYSWQGLILRLFLCLLSSPQMNANHIQTQKTGD